MAVVWKPEYETGIAVIDFDHRSLFNITNLLCDSLSRGGGGDVADTFDVLADHLRRMFTREEEIFLEAGFPEAVHHIRQHRRIEGTMCDIAQKARSDPHAVSDGEVVAFLERWLPRHIEQADKHFVPFVQAVAHAPAGA